MRQLFNSNTGFRVPGLAVLGGEEVVRQVGNGEVVFIGQMQDAQLFTRANLPSEC